MKVNCANCSKEIEKTCHNKRFCSKKCKDYFHNRTEIYKENDRIRSKNPKRKKYRLKYQRAYQHKYPERISKYSKKWKLKNPDYFQRPEFKATQKKYNKKYNEEHKEELKEKAKEYTQRPEVITRVKEYRQRPEVRKRRIELSQRPEVKTKREKYRKEYIQRPEVIIHRRKQKRKRRNRDFAFRITENLRRNFRQALDIYSKTGKILSSKKYGINYKKIIEHLKPFPKDIENHHVDHIVPLSLFDFNDPEQIKKAFMPHNLQWLTAFENRSKGNKLIMPRMKGGGK